MIIEATFVLALLVIGAVALWSSGLHGWLLVPLGFLAGAFLYISFAVLVVILGFGGVPYVALTVLMLAACAIAVVHRRRHTEVQAVSWPAALFALGGVVALVAVLRRANLVNYHHDSFEHLAIGSMLFSGGIVDINTVILQYRGLAVALLHAPANGAGDLYLPSVFPLLGLSLLVAMGWILFEGLQDRLSYRTVRWIVSLSVLLALSTNRTWFHMFYLNGHLLVSSALVLLCGGGWLQERNAGERAGLYQVLQFVAVPVLAVARPDTAFLAAVAMFPSLICSRLSRRYRSSLVLVWLVYSLGWQVFIVAQGVRLSRPVSISVGFTAVLVIVLAISLLAVVNVGSLHISRRALLAWVERSAWFSLVPAFFLFREILSESMRATWVNLFSNAGSWGYSLLMMSVLVVWAANSDLPEDLWHLRLVVTTFLPLSLLLAIARGGAYRVSEGDSLNRMMFHVLPIATVYVGAALGSLAHRASLGSSGDGEPSLAKVWLPERIQRLVS